MAHRCGEKTAGAQSERFRISVFGVCAHTVRDKNRFLLVQTGFLVGKSESN